MNMPLWHNMLVEKEEVGMDKLLVRLKCVQM